MGSWFIRAAGYYLGMVVTDIAVGLWEEHKMRREFRTYSNDNDGTVSAHVVTEDTAGTVTVVGGTGYDAKPGDILFATERPDVYGVAGTDALDGYNRRRPPLPLASEYDQGDDDSEDESPEDESEDETTDYDPAERSALEVKQYLERQRTAGNRAEFERVTAAETAGKNRASALVGAFDR